MDLVKYNEHNWEVCGDFKMVNFLLGQQSGYTKFSCFLCEWDSRDRQNHWIKKEWPKRRALIVVHKNVIEKSLINWNKVILPALHIKLGIMKQFVKALDRTGDYFSCLIAKFPRLSEAKVKERIFVGPQIRKLMKDDLFLQTTKPIEKKRVDIFRKSCKGVFGKPQKQKIQTNC